MAFKKQKWTYFRNISWMSFHSVNMPLQCNFDDRIFLVHSILYLTDPSVLDHLDYFTVFSNDAQSTLAIKSLYMFMIYSFRRINTFLKVELLSQRVWIVLDFRFILPSCPLKRSYQFILQPAMNVGAYMPE